MPRSKVDRSPIISLMKRLKWWFWRVDAVAAEHVGLASQTLGLSVSKADPCVATGTLDDGSWVTLRLARLQLARTPRDRYLLSFTVRFDSSKDHATKASVDRFHDELQRLWFTADTLRLMTNWRVEAELRSFGSGYREHGSKRQWAPFTRVQDAPFESAWRGIAYRQSDSPLLEDFGGREPTEDDWDRWKSRWTAFEAELAAMRPDDRPFNYVKVHVECANQRAHEVSGKLIEELVRGVAAEVRTAWAELH